MFQIGVATSVSREFDYSWQDTIDFCAQNFITCVQFYHSFETESFPIKDSQKIIDAYVHLNEKFNEHPEKIDKFFQDFAKLFRMNGFIVHEDWLNNQEYVAGLDLLQCPVGIENANGPKLSSFIEILENLNIKKNQIFAVLDIHRFYNNFYKDYAEELITDHIFSLIKWLKSREMNYILHIIDSKSYSEKREDWCPLFEGVIPYGKILFQIMKYNYYPARLIFEYEDKKNTLYSIQNLNKFGQAINFN